MKLRVTAELEESGFSQTAWFSRPMWAGDYVLVEVVDSEHIAVTISSKTTESTNVLSRRQKNDGGSDRDLVP